jgi:hypothetical protein
MNRDPLDRFPGRQRLFGPSAADRLLANAETVRLELRRFIDDDDKPAVSCSYRLVGCIDVEPDATTGELLLKIVQALGAKRSEGGEA